MMKMQEHEGPVNRALFHPDGTCTASCSDDQTIKIWDLRKRKLIQHYDAHGGPVTDIAFSPVNRVYFILILFLNKRAGFF